MVSPDSHFGTGHRQGQCSSIQALALASIICLARGPDVTMPQGVQLMITISCTSAFMPRPIPCIPPDAVVLPHCRHLGLLGPSNRGGLAVEDDVGSLQGDITKDVEADVVRGLQAAKASLTLQGLEVDVLGGDGDGSIADTEAEVGQVSTAVENPATLALGVL